MAELFSSFDTLLGIGRPVDVLPPENVSLPPDDDLLGSELRFEHVRSHSKISETTALTPLFAARRSTIETSSPATEHVGSRCSSRQGYSSAIKLWSNSSARGRSSRT